MPKVSICFRLIMISLNSFDSLFQLTWAVVKLGGGTDAAQPAFLKYGW